MDRSYLQDAGKGIMSLSLAVWTWFEINYALKADKLKSIMHRLVKPQSVEKENEGKYVYASGFLKLDRQFPLKDELLDVCVHEALKLSRNVEMFQWTKEHRTVWSSQQIDSSSNDWRHKNPDWFITGATFSLPEPYGIYPFVVGKEVISQVELQLGVRPVYPGKQVRDKLERHGFSIAKDSEFYYLTPQRLELYRNPKPGDYRIKYTYLPSKLYLSIIGVQSQGEIVPGKELFIVHLGKESPEKLIKSQEKLLGTEIWKKRVLCLLGVLSGVYIATK